MGAWGRGIKVAFLWGREWVRVGIRGRIGFSESLL